jgi:hypothetical protein
MKKTILTAILVCSLALNATVVATVAWNLWFSPDAPAVPLPSAVTPEDLPPKSEQLKQLRREIRGKRGEILEILASDAGDVERVNKAVEELVRLMAEKERAGIDRLRRLVLKLPDEKRRDLLDYLKKRTEAGRGMGFGHRHERKGKRPESGQ